MSNVQEVWMAVGIISMIMWGVFGLIRVINWLIDIDNRKEETQDDILGLKTEMEVLIKDVDRNLTSMDERISKLKGKIDTSQQVVWSLEDKHLHWFLKLQKQVDTLHNFDMIADIISDMKKDNKQKK